MAKNDKNGQAESNTCFVIMPISDCDGYDKGHFGRVYEDVFKKAIVDAGFAPLRADEVKQTNMIHLDILQKLLESPMAICDLSSRNPNVLFELGLRQAFDRPTVLVKDTLTENMFDIAPLRFTDYRRELKYREVLEDQRAICEAIKATRKATDEGKGINSLVNLLSLSSPARLKEVSQDEGISQMLALMRSEMADLRSEIRRTSGRVQVESQAEERRTAEMLQQMDREFFEIESLMAREAPVEIVNDFAERLEIRLAEMRFSLPSKSNMNRLLEERRVRLYDLLNVYRHRRESAELRKKN